MKYNHHILFRMHMVLTNASMSKEFLINRSKYTMYHTMYDSLFNSLIEHCYYPFYPQILSSNFHGNRKRMEPHII